MPVSIKVFDIIKTIIHRPRAHDEEIRDIYHSDYYRSFKSYARVFCVSHETPGRDCIINNRESIEYTE